MSEQIITSMDEGMYSWFSKKQHVGSDWEFLTETKLILGWYTTLQL